MSVANPYASAVVDPPAKKRRKGSGQAPKQAGLKAVPLRLGLTIIIVVVSGLGLAASSVAVNRTMVELVYSRIDADLERGLGGWASQDSLFQDSTSVAARPPTDFYAVKFFPDGTALEFNEHDTAPNLDLVEPGRGPQTVESKGDSDVHWRVMAQTDNGVTTVVAKDIAQESMILQRLAIGQVVIGMSVLLITALFAFFLVHRALRPLREVEATAKAIASGDFDRRVPEGGENTEVGELSHSLNVMLERLQGSIIELQNKEEQMRRFVGDASHELRTPLTSVKGYAELYRSGATDDAKLVLERIEAEASRMSVLVEDLLALTRAEGSRFEEADVDILELSLSVASSLRAAYPGRCIDVRSECEAIPVVRGDAARLHQVLTNLTVNAIKHGGEEAKVAIKLFDATPGWVTIEVADDGVGLSEEDAAHIFERFYRADTSRARATGGSGLGLAITKTLVESHKGSIGVQSQLGEGTVFRIDLPKDPKRMPPKA
ncbi:sensor histidine kinase [Corynebacterium pelargi]|uniref:histidine kinase n=1 Tax=Corynebacterium pelargi TaxID=1471400 RepID=A0A410W6M1_9CORY|nr:HAMP domain-containing sensor histidine kinase [Corynebacterium pelargi]QAU51678.1 putative sensor histidine kinase TcrY [Corynebacterium pelargi]GGG80441.1 two-component sensor histidine kinase [Corynebacterium pelargi]